jgi:peptidoglycan/LPS O-acetylase OafA/YrhL
MWCSQRAHQEFVFLTAGGAFALMMIRFIALDSCNPAPLRRAPRRHTEFLGMTSYPTYLFHGPLLLAFGAAVHASGIATPWWGIWPTATLFSIACCAPLGLLLERPTMAWRAGLLKRLKARSAPRAAVSSPPILGIQQ